MKTTERIRDDPTSASATNKTPRWASQTNKSHRSSQSGGGESLWGEIKAPKKKNKDSSICDEMLIKHWRFHSLFQVLSICVQWISWEVQGETKQLSHVYEHSWPMIEVTRLPGRESALGSRTLQLDDGWSGDSDDPGSQKQKRRVSISNQ